MAARKRRCRATVDRVSTTGPEDMLAAALRARAGTAPRDVAATASAQLPATQPRRVRLSVGWIVLIAVLLGVLGGGIAGWLSTL